MPAASPRTPGRAHVERALTGFPKEPTSKHAFATGRTAVPLIARLKERRDRIQAQLDRWISRGFKGGGEGATADATQKETAGQVSEVANLNRAIAEEEAKKRDA